MENGEWRLDTSALVVVIRDKVAPSILFVWDSSKKIVGDDPH